MQVPCLGRQESVHPRAIQNKAFTIRRAYQSACICAKGAMGLLWSQLPLCPTRDSLAP